jgi:hypothetical protein
MVQKGNKATKEKKDIRGCEKIPTLSSSRIADGKWSKRMAMLNEWQGQVENKEKDNEVASKSGDESTFLDRIFCMTDQRGSNKEEG